MDLFGKALLLRGLDASDIASLARLAEFVTLPDATCLTLRGTPARKVFVLMSGRCVGVVPSRGGKEMVVDRILPGRVIGELAALDGGGRVRTVRSDGPVTVARIDAGDFQDWLSTRPGAMRNLLAELAGNMRDMTDRLYEAAMHDVETRVRLFLIRLLIENGALRDGGVVEPAPSHGSIAAHVATTREAVSRALSRFARMGFIDTGRRRITVRDAAGLEAGVPSRD